MRVAKRSRPGSYRRMRIPNASPSPPKTWATTSTSGAPSFTITVTPLLRAWSRYSKGFARCSQERRGTDTGAIHGARECFERRLGTTPVRRVTRHLRQVSQQERRRGIGTREHVVEHVLSPVAQRRQGGRRRIGGRNVVVPTEGIGVAVLDDAGEIERDIEVAGLVGELVGRKARRRHLNLVLEHALRRRDPGCRSDGRVPDTPPARVGA